jgi:transcriptional regulator with PAS, ATPase and Fis domain
LFGHHRGAFSGAVGDRKGLFQSAHQGTLFLDDVNDLPLSIQPKVLDVLQRGAIRAVGSDQEVRLDVRVIAACNRPLQDLVRQNLFRADLYYRLDVIHLALPPLRDRLEDLAGLLLAIARRRTDLYQPLEAVELELVEHLRSQSFPGNIRELEHAVERALFLKSSGVTLTLDDWRKQEDEQHEAAPDGDAISEAAASLWQGVSQRGCSYSQLLKELERRVIEKALSAGGRTRRDIASLLCISERKLYQKIRAHRLAVTAQETANSRSTTAQTNTPPHSLTQAV